MSTIINGANVATFNREHISFTPNAGGETGGRYQGPKAVVRQKMDELITLGWSVKYECDCSPIATLDFSYTTGAQGGGGSDPNTDYTDTFQVFRNTVQKELLMSEHPKLVEVSATHLTELKVLIGKEPATGEGFTTAGGSAASNAAAWYLLHLYRSGVRSVEVKQPVLRVTRKTSIAYDVKFNLQRVDKLLNTATMITDSGVPSTFAIELTDLATQIAARTTLSNGYSVRSDTLLLKYGWIKDAVTAENVGRTEMQYVLEYKFGLWDTAVYGQPL